MSKKDKSKSFTQEFKEFLLQGNVIEMAIGLTVGVAFTNVVNSLVQNIIMPPIGLLLGNSSFVNLFTALNGEQYETLEAARAAEAPVLAYGQFLSDCIELLIIALAIFVAVKVITKAQSARTGK